jgi:hypothetical protein
MYVSGVGATVATAGIGSSIVSGVAGGQVQLNFVPSQTSAGVITASKTYIATTTGGSLVNATATYTTIPTAAAGTTYSAAVALAGTLAAPSTTGGVGPNNGSAADWAGGAKMIVGTGTSPVIMTLTLASAVAGNQVVNISSIDAATGEPSAVGQATITWATAGNTDLASVTAYTLTTGDTCTNTTAATTQASMASTLAIGSALTLCIVLKSGTAAAYTRSTSISVVGNGVGQIAAATGSTSGSAVIADGAVTAGNKQFVVFGNGLPGTATYTITASSTGVDGVTTVTKTTTASVIANGTFTAIALANLKKSIALSTAEAGTLAFSGTDSASKAAVVDLSTGATWYVESDKGTTAVSATAPNNSSATVTQGTVDTITAATGASTADGRITVTSGAAYEKLTIWVTKKNASGTTITSNKVVVFVSTAKTAAKTVTVTTAPATTGGLTVTVTALSDPAVTTTAYPVVDGAAITLGASAGTLSATALTTGATGNATATFYPSQLGGSMILTAVVTDPAVDPVGSVTVAAGDSVLTALTTLVNSLIAKINALNKLVIKIQKKVRA